ncbi:MAG: hypothetical protein MUE56_08065 [Ignavibacteria bacterium]|jgi:hypothetical protein|nr:hypothetical protein [Ignavibacteria bacterium]
MKKILLAVIILFASVCSAQQLQVTYVSDLNIGSIVPGAKKQISENSSDAGKFVITGNGAVMTVVVSFNFSRTISGTMGDMPVRYTASYSTGSGDKQKGTPFDPYSGTTLSFDGKNREYSIKLGAILNPAAVQTAGVYSSPVIIIINVISN